MYRRIERAIKPTKYDDFHTASLWQVDILGLRLCPMKKSYQLGAVTRANDCAHARRVFPIVIGIWLVLLTSGVNAASPEKPKVPSNEAFAASRQTGDASVGPSSVGLAAGQPTLDQMIGQMLMFGFRGLTPEAPNLVRVRDQLRNGTIGGVIIMSRNVSSSERLKRLIASIHAAGAPITPFVAVDQEGGRIQRLSPQKGFRNFPSAVEIATSSDPKDARRIYRELATELADHGINLNLGPVLDLATNSASPIIAGLDRSYGTDPTTVTRFARAFVDGHRDVGLLTAAKHFPGHGSSAVDSHQELVDMSTSWTKTELVPYAALAQDDQLDIVMVGHLYHPEVAGDVPIPATLSKQAIDGLLRRELGFKGVVITDDMEMGAIRHHYGLRDSIVRAVNAGADILLFTNIIKNDPSMPERVQSIVQSAVKEGTISRERIRASYERIMKLKAQLEPTPKFSRK